MRIIIGSRDVEEGLAALLAIDARLERVAALAGPLPLRLMPTGYDGMANIVVSQMVSKASAAAIWSRLLLATGEACLNAGTIAAMDEISLRGVGLSGAKAKTLQGLARAVLDGTVDLEDVCRLETEDAIDHLTAVKGVGRWTAEVYLMFCAGHPDIFPVGDVALRNAVAHAFGQEKPLEGEALSDACRHWSPWRSVAARLFWAYYSARLWRSADPLG